jgi:hypothetical protein
LILTVAAFVAWLGVMWRFRKDIRRSREEQIYTALLMLLIIWSALGTFLVRALYDAGYIPQPLPLLAGGIVRGIFLICGITLILLGPTKGGERRE